MSIKPYTSIKLYLSTSEKSKIEATARARGLSTSEYCKNRILKSGITVNIKTDDLLVFAQQISHINDSVNSILTNPKNSKSVSNDDIENIEELLTELSSNCRMLLKNRYKKRKDIATTINEYIQNYFESK
jgi:adenine C2-methylase RlmN of 23S rRNA A2503 and tRNA A37